MENTIHRFLGKLQVDIKALAMPAEREQTVGWCIGRLPSLYTQFQETNESRFGAEITRLVQAVVQELVQGQPAPPEARQLATSIVEEFRRLHEELGLPGLQLKLPAPRTPRSRKVG